MNADREPGQQAVRVAASHLDHGQFSANMTDN
jgi:hypothetical protein